MKPLAGQRPTAMATWITVVLCTTTSSAVYALRYSPSHQNSVLQHRQHGTVDLPHSIEEDSTAASSRILQDIEETEQQVEDVFRRLKQTYTSSSSSSNSFLEQQLQHAYATSDAGSKHTNYYQTDVAIPQVHGKAPPNGKDANATDGYDEGYYSYYGDSKYYHGNDYNKSSKSSKSDNNTRSKKHKKEKKHRGETKNIDKKLAKDGYFEDDMWNAGVDPEDSSWHYNDWAWEYDQEWLDEEVAYHEAEGSLSQNGTHRAGPPGYFTSTVDIDKMIADNNFTDDNFEGDELGLQGRSFGSFEDVEAEGTDMGSVFNNRNGIKTKQLQLPDQAFLPLMDYDGSAIRFKFNFPKVEHRVYSGPVLLKAHSAYDLSELDPEIFAVLQSVLTPYLQAEVGSTLQAYTLEVDYSAGTDEVAPGMVVTNLEVTVVLKILSNSIESLTSIDHTRASQWVRDFFSGPELYEFIAALGNNNIPVNEIVFMEQSFKSPMNTGGQVVAGIQGSNSGGGGTGQIKYSNSGGNNTGAVVGITLATLAVGAVLFLHFTGRLPSKDRFYRFGRSVRDSLSSGTRSCDDGDDFDLADIHNVEEGKRKGRNRTWSGTFRRFPTGGIRPAAIQKEPARSEDYLGDSSSKGASSRSDSSKESSSKDSSKDSSSQKKSTQRLSQQSAVYDDYSFSVDGDYNVDGDYGPTTPKTPRTPKTPNRRQSNNILSPKSTSPSGHDEFSMPEEYDTVAEDQASLYSKWSQSVNFSRFGKQQPPPHSVTGSSFGMSPLLSSPRRVTPSDIASPHRTTAGGGLGDEWSLASFDVKSPSARQMYRDFNGSAAGSVATTSSEGRGEKQSPSTWSKWGLAMPKFT
ncbi:hypothetical protein IV203_007721 [Nitzschia inconspicua]|uniref:Uncharacterized protein n=1 Tax=Nitzschia inconspicua TaxID=303405 RepID=A0A9K3PLH2_9STRA|nr:hypothetical protein IV203_007721 [Nitzschia inconspicua]